MIYNVTNSGQLTNALNSSVSGDTINIANGTYFPDSYWIDVNKNITVIGQSMDGVIIKASRIEWNRGIFNISAPSSWSNFTLQSDKFAETNEIWFHTYGIRNTSSGVRLNNIKVVNFYESGIFTFNYNNNIVLENLDYKNIVAINTSKESSGSGQGNITFQANVKNSVFENFDITHTANETIDSYGLKRSGYGLKLVRVIDATPAIFDNVMFKNIKANGKFLSAFGGSVGNIGMEAWGASFVNSTIDGLDINTSLSLEKDNPNSPARSLTVQNSKIKTFGSTTLELSISDVLIKNVEFDLTQNTTNWHVLGEFNNGGNVYDKLEKQVFEDCIFDFGSQGGNLMTYTCRLDGPKFINCTIKGNAGQTINLLEMRRDTSHLLSPPEFVNLRLEGNIQVDPVINYTANDQGATRAKKAGEVDNVIFSTSVVKPTLTVNKTNVRQNEQFIFTMGYPTSGITSVQLFRQPAVLMANIPVGNTTRSMSHATAATYNYFLRTTNSAGVTSDSDPVQIVVNAAFSVTLGVNKADPIQGYPFVLDAEVVGSVSKVELFDATTNTLVTQLTGPAYTHSITKNFVGNHLYYVRITGTDNTTVAQSNTVAVSVKKMNVVVDQYEIGWFDDPAFPGYLKQVVLVKKNP